MKNRDVLSTTNHNNLHTKSMLSKSQQLFIQLSSVKPKSKPAIKSNSKLSSKSDFTSTISNKNITPQNAFDALYNTEYMTYEEREDAIIHETHTEFKDLQDQIKRKRFAFRRRVKMPFKLKTILFSLVFACLLFVYCIAFALDNPLGALINDFTDGIILGLIDWLFGFIGNILNTDWSERAIPLHRLFTLGPISYVIISSIFAFIITGILALTWSYIATYNALDDGTSNFKEEWKPEKKEKIAPKNTTIEASDADGEDMFVASLEDIKIHFA